MRRQAIRGEDDLDRRPHLDLARELFRLGARRRGGRILVADRVLPRHREILALRSPDTRAGHAGLKCAQQARSRSRRRSSSAAGSTSRSICDGTCAMPQKSVELDPGTRSTTSARDARANSVPRPARSATATIPREIGGQRGEGVVLGGSPAIEAGPVHRAGNDPTLPADLQDDTQRVGHVRQATSPILASRPGEDQAARGQRRKSFHALCRRSGRRRAPPASASSAGHSWS